MSRHEVDAARVNIYLRAKRRVDHRRALYVPTRESFTPGAIPPYLRVGLPEKEVGRVMLVGVDSNSRALLKSLQIDPTEFSIIGKTRSIEIDPVFCSVRI